MGTRRQTTRSSFCSQAQKTSAEAKSVPKTSNTITAKLLTDQITEQKEVITSHSVSKPSNSAHFALRKSIHWSVSVTREYSLVRRNTLKDGRHSSRQFLPGPSIFDPKDIHPVRLQRNTQQGSKKCDDVASRPRSRKLPSKVLGQPLALNTVSESTRQPRSEIRENEEHVDTSQLLCPDEENPIHSNALPPRPFDQNYLSRLRTTRSSSCVANAAETLQRLKFDAAPSSIQQKTRRNWYVGVKDGDFWIQMLQALSLNKYQSL